MDLKFGILVALLWGIQPIVLKGLVNKLSPESILALTTILNFLFIFFYILFNRKTISSDYQKIDSYDLLKLFLLTLICSFVANILYFNLLGNHEPSIIIALVYSAPIFTILLSGKNLDIYKKLAIIVNVFCLYYIIKK